MGIFAAKTFELRMCGGLFPRIPDVLKLDPASFYENRLLTTHSEGNEGNVSKFNATTA